MQTSQRWLLPQLQQHPRRTRVPLPSTSAARHRQPYLHRLVYPCILALRVISSFLSTFPTLRLFFLTSTDIQSCKLRNGGCEHTCAMTAEGQVRCSCQSGWQLDVDQRGCVGETFSFSLQRICDIKASCLCSCLRTTTRFPSISSIVGKVEGLQMVLKV